MTTKIDEALASPLKRVKDVDREVEYFDAEELLKRKRALSKKKKPLIAGVTVVRGRDL